MAKFPTFDTIIAAFASASKLNANFASIVTSFTNTISRDGSTPNEMSADFDLNSNDVLNGGTLNAANLVVAGTNLNSKVAEAATSATAAATSETNAAASATAASTSETNAGASATAAAADAVSTAADAVSTAADLVLTDADQIASAASATAALTSETNAAISATNAATSETNASTSETNAATSASNASTSETNAATSASAASVSATASAASATLAQEDITRNEIATTSINISFNLIRTSGFATVGDGGAISYKRVGSAPTHNLKVTSLDGAFWEIVADNGVIPFQATGGLEGNIVGNGATNVTAFNDFIGYAQEFTNGESQQTAAPTLLFPKGHYHFNNHLNVKASCHIIGESGWGIIADAGTKIEFPFDSYGFIFHRNDTIDITTQAGTFHARGSSIQRMHIKGGGNTGTTGSGIWMRTPITIKDCFITIFAEDGIRILADAGSGGATEGNANLWRVENVTCESNGRHGLFVDLLDVNAGVCNASDFSFNGRWGVKESSSLGNTYIGCHTDGNGRAGDAGNPSTDSSMVHLSGRRYSAHVGASEAQLVATTPGTDESIWIDTESGGATAAVPTWLASQAEGTYFHGGGYRTEGASNNSVFIGCYREIGQGVGQILDPATTIGGHFGGNRGTGLQIFNKEIIGKISFSNDESQFETTVRNMDLVINPAANILLRAAVTGDASNGVNLLSWDESSGYLIMGQHANVTSRRPIFITTDLSTNANFGRAANEPGGRIVFAQGFWVGNGLSSARFVSNASTAPTSGAHGRGDLFWNLDPSATGAPLGWICTVAGTPGTFVEIRGVADQTSGANQGALTNSSGGTRDGTISAVSGSGADVVINDNFTELHTLLDELRTALVGNGVIKGSV